MKKQARFIYKNSEILIALKKLAAEVGRTPTKREINACKWCPSDWTVYRRFGTLRNAFKKAGIEFKATRIIKAEALR